MKVNKAKVAVTSLAIAAVAAMVGSISGTVAWFQYSTRASAAYTAATAHATESIQIRLAGGEWSTGLDYTEVRDYINAARGVANDTALRPVTTGEQKKDGHLNKLYKSPIYQYGSMENWEEAGKMDYVHLPLEFRALDIDGAATETTLSKKVWLTRALIEQNNANTKKDISDAIRVHLDSDQNNNDFLFSKNESQVKTIGELDLNGDGNMDRDIDWKFDPADPDGDLVLYGIDASKVRGQFVDDDAATAGLAKVPANAIYRNSTDTKDYILRDGNWEEVNVGNAAAKYAGEFDDDDEAYAAICLPDGEFYHDTGDTKYYRFDTDHWTEVTRVDKGEFADDKAAQIAIASPLMQNGKFYRNSTDNKVYVWEGAPAGSWSALDDAAAFKGAFASESVAALEIAKAGIAEGFIYQNADDSFYVWENGEWKGIESSSGYLAAYASDYDCEEHLAPGDLVAGKIYKVSGDGSYKKYNGSAWVAIPANGDGAAKYADGPAAILAEGTQLAENDLINDTGAGMYKKYNGSAWVAITPDTTAADGNAAIINLKGDAALASYVVGWTYTVAGGSDIRMWNGSAWIAVPDYTSGLEAQKDLDPVDEGTLYYDNTVDAEAYRIFENGDWADAYYNDDDGSGNPVKGYASAQIAEVAINHDKFVDGVDEEYLHAGDIYYDTTNQVFKELKLNIHNRFLGWEEKPFLAESYAFDSTDIIANDTNPRNITGGKELGKTVIAAADAAALADLKAAEKVQEGDLAYNEDDKLQYIFDGTDWKVNADEEVAALSDIASLDEEGLAKSYHLTVADAEHEIGIYEVINGKWVKRDGRNLRVDVTIYLEGWQELDGSALWEAKDYVDAQFNVGLRFSGEAHNSHN